MTISEHDLKLLKSERMTDFADGGGKMTAVEVVDGQVNNLYNDISQLDRTYGRVSLRKAYAAVQTANTDTYLGAHIILTDPPDDPAVNVTLFTTESWTDERTAARDRIESYSIAGPETQWILYGDHVVGQKLLMLYSLPNAQSFTVPTIAPTPDIGDILLLSVEKTGYAANQQFVRITKIVSRETLQFTDANGNFYKDVITIEISNALRYTFSGAAPDRYVRSRNDALSSPTLFRNTSVADAAEYYGVKKVLAAVDISDTQIEIGSPYGALVPSAQAETPLVDIAANLIRPNYVQSGTEALSASATLSGSAAPDYAARLFLGRGFLPGSLALTIAGTAYKDDSNGNIVLSNGTAGAYGGFVDYAAGAITLTKTASWSVSVSATATPAVAVYANAGTSFIPISINNRGFSYVNTLNPKPTPGSLIVDYKALDKWYRLYDDGLGHLRGIVDGIGSGTVNYATGSVSVTFSALPDVDSSVIYAWSTPTDYAIETLSLGNGLVPMPDFTLTLVATDTDSDYQIDYSTIVITWTNSGAKTATCAADGTLSGDATGRVALKRGADGLPELSNGYRQWQVKLRPNTIPPSGTVFNAAFSQQVGESGTASASYAAPNLSFTIPVSAAIKAGSLGFSVAVSGYYIPNSTNMAHVDADFLLHIRDDGAGGLRADRISVVGETPRYQSLKWAANNHAVLGGAIAGSVNYASGVVTLDASLLMQYNSIVGMETSSVWLDENNGDGSAPISKPIFELRDTTLTAAAQTVSYEYTETTASSSATPAANQSLSELHLDITPFTTNGLLAGSLKFVFGDDTVIDRGGLLYRAHSVTTDAATVCGSIDYATGNVILTGWSGGANSIDIKAAAVEVGDRYVIGVVGRTPGSPLAPGQFQLVCVDYQGNNLVASADNNGNITHEWMKGSIDWLSGIFKVGFGKKVLDSALSQEIKDNADWYDPANVDPDGYIWQPLLVKPETITFNAVLISYIPLDADILGVETVRLPQDGRVPLFRVGNVAVIHNTQALELPDPLEAGSVHDCGRTLLSYAKLFDADGLIVPTTKYTADLDAGTVTMADPLDLTGYVQPLHIEHRIEDMALVTDVQITGGIKLMKPVRHAYPALTTFLSSALVISDMQARVSNLFDQQTWGNVFSDALSGSAAGASFNDVLYPIATTNAGAIQERWAIVFTGATAFNLYGEYSGLVASGTTGADFAPINPITGVPYFELNHLGWGSGWSAGNVLRFNTIAANYPLWLARTTLQSDPAVYTDHFKLQIRGDAN
jgi:hypothetical protein